MTYGHIAAWQGWWPLWAIGGFVVLLPLLTSGSNVRDSEVNRDARSQYREWEEGLIEEITSMRLLAAQLDTSIGRWLDDLSDPERRRTLVEGGVSLAAKACEKMLLHAVGVLQSSAPTIVTEALTRRAPNKTVDMLTFGDLAKIVERVTRTTRLSGGESLARPAELRLLMTLVGTRNDFTHDRFRVELGQPLLGVEAFLRGAREFCRSSLVEHIGRLEAGDESLISRQPHQPAAELVELHAGPTLPSGLPIVPGRRYGYTEDEDKLEVEILADYSRTDFFVYRLRVTKVLRGSTRHDGETYTVTMKRGVRFEGKWELHPLEN